MLVISAVWIFTSVMGTITQIQGFQRGTVYVDHIEFWPQFYRNLFEFFFMETGAGDAGLVNDWTAYSLLCFMGLILGSFAGAIALMGQFLFSQAMKRAKHSTEARRTRKN